MKKPAKNLARVSAYSRCSKLLTEADTAVFAYPKSPSYRVTHRKESRRAGVKARVSYQGQEPEYVLPSPLYMS